MVGGGMLANEFIRLPYQFLANVPPWIARWGQEHKDFVRNAYKRTIVITGPVQEMPLFDARVQADPKVKDHWGIPVARLSGGRHPHTIEIAHFLAAKATDWLKEAGAVQVWQRVPGPSLSGGQHQAGTCRMGNDPKTSVVNKDCQLHEVDNVYVIDASVHVTNGGFNPALTILANAYRASDTLLKAWKGSKVRS
jgi:choline dehydrogenase-like flavoprotein